MACGYMYHQDLCKMAENSARKAAMIEAGLRPVDASRPPYSARNVAKVLGEEIALRVQRLISEHPDWAKPGYYSSDEEATQVRPLLRAQADADYALAVLNPHCPAV